MAQARKAQRPCLTDKAEKCVHGGQGGGLWPKQGMRGPLESSNCDSCRVSSRLRVEISQESKQCWPLDTGRAKVKEEMVSCALGEDPLACGETAFKKIQAQEMRTDSRVLAENSGQGPGNARWRKDLEKKTEICILPPSPERPTHLCPSIFPQLP